MKITLLDILVMKGMDSMSKINFTRILNVLEEKSDDCIEIKQAKWLLEWFINGNNQWELELIDYEEACEKINDNEATVYKLGGVGGGITPIESLDELDHYSKIDEFFGEDIL